MNKIMYFASICFLLVSCSADDPVSTGIVDALERIGIITDYREYKNTNTENEDFSNAVKDERVYLSATLSSIAGSGTIQLKKAGFISVGGDDLRKIALVSTIVVVSLGMNVIKDSDGKNITSEANTAKYNVYEQNINKVDFWDRENGWQNDSTLSVQYILAKEDTYGYTEFILKKDDSTYTIIDGDGTLGEPRLFYKKM